MDFNKLMQQAQAMQKKMEKSEQELQNAEYIGESGGEVSVKMTGAFEVLEVNISEEMMSSDNREMLQDMLLIAFNDAVAKATAEREEKLGAVTQGLNIPGLK